MKILAIILASLFATSAHATSIRQENGVLLAGAKGKLGWTKKYITVDHESAAALFDLLAKFTPVKTDGEDGLESASVKYKTISCRREKNVVQGRREEPMHVATRCELEIPYGIVAYLWRLEGQPKFRIETSSPELDEAMQKNSDVKRNGDKLEFANGAISCRTGSYSDCDLIESEN